MLTKFFCVRAYMHAGLRIRRKKGGRSLSLVREKYALREFGAIWYIVIQTTCTRWCSGV